MVSLRLRNACAIALVTIIFAVNLAAAIWGYLKARDGGSGVSRLYTGEGSTCEMVNAAFHALINTLFVGLLGASSCCLQLLSSPTRQDVDKTHRRGIWMDIGVLSLHNFSYLPEWRTWLCALLLIATLPIHLVYNSTMFITWKAWEYGAALVSEQFLYGAPASLVGPKFPLISVSNATFAAMKSAYGNGWERLEPDDCIKAYQRDFVTDYRNLLLITADVNVTNSMFAQWAIDLYHPYTSWMVSRKIDPQNWHVGGHMIKYCIAEPIPHPECHVDSNASFLAVVATANLVLTVLVIASIAMVTKGHPLCTIGDAINEFLLRPDGTTKFEFACEKPIQSREEGFISYPSQHPDCNRVPYQWHPSTSRWRNGASWRCWAFFNIFWLVLLASIGYLLYYSSPKLHPSYPPIDSQTFSGDSTGISGWSSIHTISLGSITMHPARDVGILIQQVLTANFAQVILSILYLSYYGLFASMLAAYEWTTYCAPSPNKERKGLRVSDPKTDYHRGCYLLMLPFRYSIPLLALSGTLRWMISQTLFLIHVEFGDQQGRPVNGDATFQPCYRRVGMLALLSVGASAIIAVNLFGLRTLKKNAIFVGSCSADISAACNSGRLGVPLPLTAEGELNGKPLWGVTSSAPEEPVRHLGFSVEEVDEPAPGGLYI